VNDDEGRILSALVGVAELGACRPGARRGLALDRHLQRPRQLRCRQPGERGGTGSVDAAHQRRDPVSVARRNEVLRREREERELAIEVALHVVAPGSWHAVRDG
jgi:hypothetical protein